MSTDEQRGGHGATAARPSRLPVVDPTARRVAQDRDHLTLDLRREEEGRRVGGVKDQEAHEEGHVLIW